MRYPPHIIEQLKTRLNIVEEVRRVVPNLKKKGRYFWANCPFHSEKSASFHVREEGNYYCFGCGAAGDVINFVQETQGGTFAEVVQRLAQQVGFKLPEYAPADPVAEQNRQNGYNALERAAQHFHRNLPGSPGLAYLGRRSLSATTVTEFLLGYAHDSWTDLSHAMASEGFKPEVLREAGLTAEGKTGKGDYDRFRGRVIFPIHDTQGRIVGFGGRILDSGEPKYLNSPETTYFAKSRLLYNLHRAKPNLRNGNQPLVLVEGYMDVISLWQAGFKTAVAPLGTSITEEQIGILWHHHAAPIICLDGDAAGKSAAIRAAMKVLPELEPGKSVQFVWLPQGEDPDSLIQKDGLATFQQLLANPTPLEQVLWQHLSTQADLTTADGRASVESEMGGLLASIKNVIIRRAYAQILKDKLYQATRSNNINPGTRAGGPQQVRSRDEKAPTNYRPAVQGNTNARYLLALVCRWPHLLPQVDESIAKLDFPAGPVSELVRDLFRAHIVQRLSPEEMAAHLQNGPHAHTVAELLRSTGVEAIDEAFTSPRVEFDKVFTDWYHTRQQSENRRKMLEKTDWSDPEQWQRFKNLGQDMESRESSSPSSEPVVDLTSDRDQPM